MERYTEKFKDGRNILRKGISDVFHIGFGRFFDGEAVDKLAEYEDLEEQGKLMKLPCAVGDKVYWVNNWFVVRASGLTNNEWHITESNVSRFFCAELGLFVKMKNGENVSALEFGKTLFLTKEEAEAALTELQM